MRSFEANMTQASFLRLSYDSMNWFLEPHLSAVSLYFSSSTPTVSPLNASMVTLPFLSAALLLCPEGKCGMSSSLHATRSTCSTSYYHVLLQFRRRLARRSGDRVTHICDIQMLSISRSRETNNRVPKGKSTGLKSTVIRTDRAWLNAPFI